MNDGNQEFSHPQVEDANSEKDDLENEEVKQVNAAKGKNDDKIPFTSIIGEIGNIARDAKKKISSQKQSPKSKQKIISSQGSANDAEFSLSQQTEKIKTSEDDKSEDSFYDKVSQDPP